MTDKNRGDLIPLSRGAGARKPARPHAPVPDDARQMEDPPAPPVAESAAWIAQEVSDIESDLTTIHEDLGDLERAIVVGLIEAIERNGDDLRSLVRAVERLGDILDKRLS